MSEEELKKENQDYKQEEDYDPDFPIKHVPM